MKDKVKEHLRARLEKCCQYFLSNLDKEIINKFGLAEFIYKKLLSAKYRKWSIPKTQSNLIKKVVYGRVKNNLPLLFTFPFGGYKLWRLPTTPEADWAEFFSLAYYLEYLSPIAAVYKPGFEFLLTSDEVIIERMDNVPKSETDQYTKTFQKLVEVFKQHLPKNARLEFKLIRDLYPAEEFDIELKKLMPKNIDEEWNKQPKDKQEARIKMSALNIRMEGKENWGALSHDEQNKKIKLGAVYHDAYISLPKRVRLVKGPDKIVLFPQNIAGIPCVPVGSTKASVTKFWTGVGFLEKTNKGFKEVIYSPAHFEKIKNVEKEIVPVDLIDLKNFKNISLLNG